MRCRSRSLLCIASLVLATVLLPGTALASPCEGNADIHDRGGEAAAECPGSGADNGTTQPISDGGASECTAERAADPDAWWLSYDVPDSVVPGDGQSLSQHALRPPEGQTVAVYRDCNGEVRSGLLWVPEPEAGSSDDGDGIFVARQEARARVEPGPPAFAVSPQQAVVQFPTWLWLEDDYWQPASATSTTPGGMTVTVEARPVEVIWDLDEGIRVCEGPGVPWSEAAQSAYDAQPDPVRGKGNPACTFTFVNASSTRPSGVFEAAVTVVWEFSWSLNGADRGTFGSVEASESWSLTVGEIQAVITG